MQLNASCELSFLNDGPVPMVMMLRPRSGAGQWVSAESFDALPATDASEYVDIYGNLCQRIVGPPGEFRICATASVRVADAVDLAPGLLPTPIELLPDVVLHYLLASRYCESDKLQDLANEVTQGAASPGWDQVELIRSWVRDNVAYESGASTSSTSALDTVQQRAGVCRDMAHVGIALTRAMDIPARMVVGYLHGLKPMDLHAWFEAYIGTQWYVFDPKEDETLGGRIVLGYGRDAADVALATQFGSSQLQGMRVSVERVE